MKLEALHQRITLDSRFAIRVAAALFSVGSATIHLAFAPEHFSEWWGYGWFFIVVAILQDLYAVGLVAPRGRLFTAPWYLITGISLNLWVVGFYTVTRTVGVPLFGPHAGHVEGLGVIDILSKTMELGTVASLSALLIWRPESKEILVRRLKSAAIALLGVAATLAVIWTLARVQAEQPEAPFSSSTFEAGQTLAADAASPALSTPTELLPLLVRSGYGPRGNSADVLYTPPVFFQVLGEEEPPKVSLKRPTFVFLLEEADHDHKFGLAPQPPRTVLRLDEGDAVEPYQVTVIQEGDEHRRSQILFPMPVGMTQEILDKGKHTLTFSISLGEGLGESIFTWQLPLPVTREVAKQREVPSSLQELMPLLTRSGYGPGVSSSMQNIVSMVYSPPPLFQAQGVELPASSRERSTIIFTMREVDECGDVFLLSQPPQVFLRVDGGERIEPYEVTVLTTDGLAHRTTQLLFPLPSGLDPAAIDQEEHTLTIVTPLGSDFSWQLPLELPVEAASISVPEVAASLPVSGLTRRLSHTQERVQYGGSQGIRVEATYATPEYFAAALPKDLASRYLPDQFTVFLVTERLHTADLPGSPPDIVLSLDKKTYKPDLLEQVTTSPHHRVTLVRFPTAAPTGLRHRVMELLLPGDSVMTWHLPISYAGLESRSGLGVSWVWLLAVLGGLVAAMWPCLFQLTVFFIPSLGGLSMHEASSTVSLQRRTSVVKAALFFVLGFTVVYTTAGALLGFAAGRLGDLSGFYTWQRYLGIAGGVVIIVLALRVAAQVRAPLVCKMPGLSRMGHRDRPANPIEMMVAGVAFATGCMTCFGAAIVVAMVVYVGLAGSAVVGAFTLFLFSMGMGIPLVIAAIAMSKVLPLLSRFEQAIRWIGLASSLVMVGFAVLLITGNYMVLTEWVYRMVPSL